VTLNTVPAIVSDPIRLHVVVFGSTLNATVPFPDPDPPLVTVIHALLLAAVHGQPAVAVTVLLPLAPDATNVWLVGDTTGEHESPACVTVNVVPATDSVPLRAAPEFGATSNVADPLPDPAAPPVTLIQTLLLTAVHGQPEVIVTVVLPLPPDEVNDWLEDESDPVQLAPDAS